MNRVKSERLARSNPNMKVKTNIVATADPPSVSFEFIDGTKVCSVHQRLLFDLSLKKMHPGSLMIALLFVSTPPHPLSRKILIVKSSSLMRC